MADGKTIHIIKIGDKEYLVPEDKLESICTDLNKVKKSETEKPKFPRKES